MKIYTLGEILKTGHIGDEKYVRYEEIERLRKDLKKYGLHHEGCEIWSSEPYNKCSCGFEQASREGK